MTSLRTVGTAGTAGTAAAWTALLLVLTHGLAVAAAAAEPRVLNLLIDPEGLPALHEEQEDGPPVMWMPQFRLFDGEGQLLWSRTRMPAKRKDFRRELAHHVAVREPRTEGRTLRREARHFLRRGGLPLNLTTLPPFDLTVVEYWTADCSECDELSHEVNRFFSGTGDDDVSVQILRVFIPLRD